MKKTKANFSLLLLAGFLLPGALICQAAEPNPSEDQKSLFFARIKNVADSGKLFDPEAIAAILALNLESATAEQTPQPPDCSQTWMKKSVQVTTSHIVGSSWYEATPAGVQNMKVPGHFINPSTVIDTPPSIDYKITRRIACNGRLGIQDNTEATLHLSSLSGFACIGAGDIERLFPAAKYNEATDGVFLYDYQGKRDDDAGTSLRIVYRMGAPCAIGVTITQYQNAGLRFKRALRTRQPCVDKAYREYCTTHPPFTWADGDIQDKMDEYADGVCGTIDAAYQKERAADGTMPAAQEQNRKSRRAYPCDGYDGRSE